MRTIKKSIQALREEDHRRALYAALVFIMLLILFFLLVSLEVPDPPLEEEVIEITMDDIEYDFGSQPEGGSQSSDMNPDQVTPLPENVIDPSQEYDTQDESPVEVVSSNGSNNSNSNQETTPPVDNTFTFGQNNGNGQGNGSGDAFGSGDGVGGNGQGNSPGDGTYNPSRKMIQSPSFVANVQEEGKIALDIYVDANGNVVKTRFKSSKSNSGSNYLKQLAEKAARTMKYDKKPGAGVEHVGYQIFSFKKS
jgi:outer membrane biosynthesis protein TonB